MRKILGYQKIVYNHLSKLTVVHTSVSFDKCTFTK
jgi:hypothetical protein